MQTITKQINELIIWHDYRFNVINLM